MSNRKLASVTVVDPFASVPAPTEDIVSLVVDRPKPARAARHAPDLVVTVLAKKNPKKPNTQAFARFARYQTGKTVAHNLKRGVRRDDLRFDVAHGFISIA